ARTRTLSAFGLHARASATRMSRCPSPDSPVRSAMQNPAARRRAAEPQPVKRSACILSAKIRRIRVDPGSRASGMNADSADLRGSRPEERGRIGLEADEEPFHAGFDEIAYPPELIRPEVLGIGNVPLLKSTSADEGRFA